MNSTQDTAAASTAHVSVEANGNIPNNNADANTVAAPNTNSTVDVNPHFRPTPNNEVDFNDINIFQASQMGKLDVVARLIDSDKSLATSKDVQDVTALHWAAINNNIPIAKYLLDHGAEVDAVGGELVATPLHWCSRNGHLYMAKLLIKYGADPLLQDCQGFNALHLATHSSNAMLVLYLLMAKDIEIDTADTLGHTSLMWAAYQGDSLSVDILLKYGARVDTKDREGFTPLHWAVVKCNRECLAKLLKAGGDVSAKDRSGKSPVDMVNETRANGIWERALSDAKLANDGVSRRPLFEMKTTNTIIYFIPYVTLTFGLELMAMFRWYIALPLAIAQFLFGHIGSIKFLLRTRTPNDMTQTPYYTAVFQATAFLVGHLPPVLAEPRILCRLRLRTLFLLWRRHGRSWLDKMHHLNRATERDCSADGRLWFIKYLSIMSPTYTPAGSDPCILGNTMCGYFQYDAFTTSLAIWSIFQVTWPGFLFLVQIIQVGQARTTAEALNFQKHRFLGKGMNIRQRILRSLSENDNEIALNGRFQEESINLLEAGAGAAEDDISHVSGLEDSHAVGVGDHSGHNHSGHDHSGHGHRKGGGNGIWGLLVGTARRHRNHDNESDESNPFDFGLWQNCLGFFSDGRLGPTRGVSWYTFYEVEPTRANFENPTLTAARRV
ncbi:palmitoyltransferase akr1 [Entomortierella beljakovae]|nr:palmitoyltransferase akr1 [Entomortierella beljakovae]